tara:strand:+ start:10897 stop:11409 length:513 start_codon:yes stop_codon:yes gene_type:complete
MSEQTKPTLKGYFETGDTPTQSEFVDLVDSFGLQSETDANTAKTGITTAQANEITANTAKVSYTDAPAVAANTAKVGITTAQAADIVANNAKVTYDAAAAVSANTDKISFDSTSSTKLGTIEENAEVNTINTSATGEPSGSDLVLNVVSLTQAEYDAGTKVSTTLYAIVG